MVGTITLRHVLCHPILVVREYGSMCIVKCVIASAKAYCTGNRVTFLDIVADSGHYVI